MNEINPFIFALDNLFSMDGDGYDIQTIKNFLKYFVNTPAACPLFGYSVKLGQKDKITYIFKNFVEGFHENGYFADIRSIAPYIDPRVLDDFYTIISKSQLINVLVFYLSRNRPDQYLYLFDHKYVYPSDIPKAMRDNGVMDYPEYLDNIDNSMCLFYDLEFITTNRTLLGKAYRELIEVLSEIPYLSITEPRMDIPELKMLDNVSFEDFDNSQILLSYGINRRNDGQHEFFSRVRERNYGIINALNFVQGYIDKADEDGIPTDKRYEHYQELLAKNYLNRINSHVADADLDLFLKELNTRLGLIREIDRDVGNFLMSIEYVLYFCGFYDMDIFMLRNNIDVKKCLEYFVYNLIRKYIQDTVHDSQILKEMNNILNESKPLPLVIMDGFILENVSLREKQLGDYHSVSCEEIKNFIISGLEDVLYELAGTDDLNVENQAAAEWIVEALKNMD